MVKTDWFRFYEPGEEPARFSRIVLSLDSANKATELSDYSVFTVWGVDYKRYYLFDVVRLKLNYPDLKRKVIELTKKYDARTILIEDKASGTQLIQDLKSEHLNGVTECGHLMLHEGKEVQVDTEFRVNLRSPESSTAADVEEIESNAFAAAVLMPEFFCERIWKILSSTSTTRFRSKRWPSAIKLANKL